MVWLVAACGSDGNNGTDPGRPDASPPTSYSDPLTAVDSLAIGITDGTSGIEEMHALPDGRIVYCTSQSGVHVIDASDPADLTRAMQIDTGPCQHLAVSGDILYVSHRGDVNLPESRIRAWDLSQAVPDIIGTFTKTDTFFEGIAADGNMIYAAARENGILILERNGNQIAERGSLSTGFVNAWTVAVSGTTLYVADAGAGVAVIDIVNPDLPTQRGSTNDEEANTISGAPMSLAVEGTTVYVGAGYGGIAVVDAGDPTNPLVRSQTSTSGFVLQVAYQNGFLHAANWSDVRVFDMSEPAAPVLVATERLPSQAGPSRVRALAARGSNLFVGEWNGLHSYTLHAGRTAPDIWTQESEVSFFHVEPGRTKAYALAVRNNGTAPLVASIELQGEAFSIDGNELDIQPNATAAVEISYRATASFPDQGKLTISSADPDQGIYEIPLLGNGPTLKVGDKVPEIAVALLYGGEWRANQQLGKIQVLSYFAVF